MIAAPGPNRRLSGAEALACLAHADRPVLLATAADALAVVRAAEEDPRNTIEARNALLLAAAAVHLLLWGPPVAPGRAGRA